MEPASYLVWTIVLTVTSLTTAGILFAALTGRVGDPGVEQEE